MSRPVDRDLIPRLWMFAVFAAPILGWATAAAFSAGLQQLAFDRVASAGFLLGGPAASAGYAWLVVRRHAADLPYGKLRALVGGSFLASVGIAIVAFVAFAALLWFVFSGWTEMD